MARVIDLDEVNITSAVHTAWSGVAERLAIALAQLKAAGREIGEIPIERARVEDDGSLTIFVEMPGVLEASMKVPPDQWMWRDPRKNN